MIPLALFRVMTKTRTITRTRTIAQAMMAITGVARPLSSVGSEGPIPPPVAVTGDNIMIT